jgi:hypothetical protein
VRNGHEAFAPLDWAGTSVLTTKARGHKQGQLSTLVVMRARTWTVPLQSFAVHPVGRGAGLRSPP